MSEKAFNTPRSSVYHEFRACSVAADEIVNAVIILGTGNKSRCPECAKRAHQEAAA